MTADVPKITVLMATYNGEPFLAQQLASISQQIDVDWSLWVSDDGSSDGTWAIVEDFASSCPDRTARMFRGPGRGSAANFLSMLCHPDLPEGFVALADQDDVWYPDKLARAAARLKDIKDAAVYSAHSRHILEDGRPTGRSRLQGGLPSFGNALVQNRVSGHSAVLNAEAVRLVRKAGPVNVPFHDWWIYQLVTGAGGAVVTDRDIVLDYRQHDSNVLGSNRGVQSQLARAKLLLGGRFGKWHLQNLHALNGVRHLLTGEATQVLDEWSATPRAGSGRVRAMDRLGLRRDQRLANGLLKAAAYLGRF